MGKRRAGSNSENKAPLRRSERATAIAGPRFSYRYTSDEESEVPKTYAAASRRDKKGRYDSASEGEDKEPEKDSDDEGEEDTDGELTEPEANEDAPHLSPESEDASTEAEEDADENSSNASKDIEHNDLCNECGTGGTLLCCDHCPRVYHLHCLDPPLATVPTGDWGCPNCPKEKPTRRERSKRAKVEEDQQSRPKRRRIQKRYYDEDDSSDSSKEERPIAGNDVCNVCSDGGFLIVCDKCEKNYHLKCVVPPLQDVPEGDFICNSCAEGTEGTVDRIICWRSGSSDSEMDDIPKEGEEKKEQERQYFVKWINRSYIHCEWVGEQRLQKIATLKLRNFQNRLPPERRSISATNKRDINNDLFDPDWQQIDRVIGEKREGNRMKYMIKWKDLSYDEATWEYADDPLMRGRSLEAHLKKFRTFNDYEHACEEAQERVDRLRQMETEKAEHILKTRPSLRSRRRLQGSPIVRSEDEARTPTGEDRMDTDSSGVPTPTDVKMSDADDGDEESKAKEKDKSIPGDYQKMEKQPDSLRGELHDYQLEGVNWLCFSWFRHTNVILADEMGLGKTIQTIAYFAALHELFSVRGPHLLVVPLSTIKMWEREFSNWAPHLNTIIYRGKQPGRKIIRDYEFYFKEDAAKRKKADKLVKFNVLVTSYEMILADSGELRNLPWEGIVIDEAHRLKNQNSKLFQVLIGFKSQHCVLLTGTPLQNNLGELFHLLNFLVRDKFSSLEEFEKEFTDLGKEDQISKLHAMLAPHMLRRLKSDVMKEIPAKSEMIVPVDLSALQKKYYRAILTRNYEMLRKGSKNAASLLNIVMELKKCANHPYLFDSAEPPTKTKKEAMRLLVNASGKMMLLDRMLAKLKDQGHRVLIFSQMTRLLDILEDYVLECGYKYERIDGRVVGDDRQARIDRFNEPNSDRFLFLLSTRAGGLGINLATADTVIIYDADWNPHNDMQALSRAHRIGQTSKVMVYRLVTRASIEERIIQISKSKMMLDHIVVKKMGRGGETLLQAGELDDILRFGTEEIFAEDKPEEPKAGENEKEEGKDGEKEKEKEKEDGKEGEKDDKKGDKEGEQEGKKEGENGEKDEKGEKAEGEKNAEKDEKGEKAEGEKKADDEEVTWDRAKYGDIPTSKGIYYDDSAIEKLLDRARGEAEEAETQLDSSTRVQNEYLNSFKVASYSVDKDLSKNDTSYWEKLLHESHLRELEEENLSRSKDRMEGRRQRRLISYCEDQPFFASDDDEWELGEEPEPESEDEHLPDTVLESPNVLITPAPAKRKYTRHAPGEPYKRARTKTTKGQGLPHKVTAPRVGSIPLMGGGIGKSILVLGFNQSQRKEFLRLLMHFGVGDGTWAHFMPHLPHTLSNKSQPEIAAYGANLLSHLLEQPNTSDKFADGVPKENVNQREALSRIATIHLIRQKVIEVITPAGANLPPKEFDIEEANCTDLHITWETMRSWKKDHDKALLFAVLKHGYGKYPNMANDPDLGLIPPILEQQKDKIPHPGLGGNPTSGDSPNSVIYLFLRKRMAILEQALNIEHHIRVTRSLMQAQGQSMPPALPHASSTAASTAAYASRQTNTIQRVQVTPGPSRPSTHVQITPAHNAPTNKPFSSVPNTSKFTTPHVPPLTPVVVSGPIPPSHHAHSSTSVMVSGPIPGSHAATTSVTIAPGPAPVPPPHHAPVRFSFDSPQYPPPPPYAGYAPNHQYGPAAPPVPGAVTYGPPTTQAGYYSTYRPPAPVPVPAPAPAPPAHVPVPTPTPTPTPVVTPTMPTPVVAPTPAVTPTLVTAPIQTQHSPQNSPKLTPAPVPASPTPAPVPTSPPHTPSIPSNPTPISTPLISTPVTPTQPTPVVATPTPTPAVAAASTPASPPASVNTRISFITKFKELYSAVHNMKEQMLTFIPGVSSEAIRNDLHAIGTLALETELKLREVPPSSSL